MYKRYSKSSDPHLEQQTVTWRRGVKTIIDFASGDLVTKKPVFCSRKIGYLDCFLPFVYESCTKDITNSPEPHVNSHVNSKQSRGGRGAKNRVGSKIVKGPGYESSESAPKQMTSRAAASTGR